MAAWTERTSKSALASTVVFVIGAGVGVAAWRGASACPSPPRRGRTTGLQARRGSGASGASGTGPRHCLGRDDEGGEAAERGQWIGSHVWRHGRTAIFIKVNNNCGAGAGEGQFLRPGPPSPTTPRPSRKNFRQRPAPTKPSTPTTTPTPLPIRARSPGGIKTTGEIWLLILAGGGKSFKDEANPKPVFHVGQPQATRATWRCQTSSSAPPAPSPALS
jgi:hypothetical protein